MLNLIEAWGNYYFKTEDRYFKISRIFANYCIYENVEDDINVHVMNGTLEECVNYLNELGAVNYDPLAKWRK